MRTPCFFFRRGVNSAAMTTQRNESCMVGVRIQVSSGPSALELCGSLLIVQRLCPLPRPYTGLRLCTSHVPRLRKSKPPKRHQSGGICLDPISRQKKSATFLVCLGITCDMSSNQPYHSTVTASIGETCNALYGSLDLWHSGRSRKSIGWLMWSVDCLKLTHPRRIETAAMKMWTVPRELQKSGHDGKGVNKKKT